MNQQRSPHSALDIVLAGTIAWAIVLFATSAVRAHDWPMFGQNAQRTFSTQEKLPDRLALRWALQLPPLTPAWLDQTRVRTDAAYRPIVVGKRMIVASSHDDSVAAFDVVDGREIWRFFTSGPVRYAPAAESGRVFVGSDDGYLYALAADDGKLLWKLKAAPKHRPVLGNGRVIDTWCVRGGPVVEDGRVYFAAGLWPFMGVFVCAADAATGEIIWANSGDGSSYLVQPHGSPSFSGLAPQGALAVADGRLLVPNGRAMPASLDLATGAFQYFHLNNKYGGDRVSVGRQWFFNDSQIFHPANGVGVMSIASAPVIIGDMAYTVSRDEIEAYDVSVKPGPPPPAGSKTKLPAPKIPKTDMKVKDLSVIIAAGGRLYVGSKGAIAVHQLPLDDERPPLATFPVEGTPVDLIAASGHLIVTTGEGTIQCFGDAAQTAPAAGKAAAQPEQAKAGDDPAVTARAKQLLADSAAAGGYVVVLGASGEPLARALAAIDDQIHITVIEPDAAAGNALRSRLQKDGLYGVRIAVAIGDIAMEPLLPPYLANLIVADASATVAPTDAALQGIYRLLHPYRGTAYLPESWSKPLAALEKQAADGRAVVSDFGDGQRLARRNGLPGAGSWTHEHGDAANTRVSSDTLAKAPLGILWFGGSSHDGILPRHGHGPQPQVIGGRIFILGMDMLRAMDAYTGRVLWEADIPGVGSYYDNTAHHPGANGVGTNFIATPDAIYIVMRDRCLQLDPDTGKITREFPLPQDLPGRTNEWVWSYLNVDGDYLVGSGAPPMTVPVVIPKSKSKSKKPDDDDDEVDIKPKIKEVANPRTVGSRVLFVMDRRSGKVLWSRAAEIGDFRNNAICLGNGKLFAIDRPPFDLAKKRFIPGGDRSVGRLHAIDLATGKDHWSTDEAVFGTWLGYSVKHDVLIETGRNNRDSLGDEVRGMRAYAGKSGDVLWFDQSGSGPAMIRRATVMKDKGAADLLTGKPLMFPDPITGVDLEWGWTRNYGCNTPAGSQNLLTFRSGAAGFYDLARNGGTGNFGGFRSSCTNNLIVADGLICAPDYTRTCTCSYPLQTSLALIPDEAVEVWTFMGRDDEPEGPIQRLGVNLGAPGDRVDDAGTLWLEYPPTGGKSPKIELKIEPKDASFFRQHTSTVEGAAAWVAASGTRGVQRVTIDLNADTDKDDKDDKKRGDKEDDRRYTVKLYFVQPASPAPAAGKMEIQLQGKVVDPELDVLAAAGGTNRSLVREYRNIVADEELTIDLKSLDADGQTLLSGIELIAETGAAAAR